MLDEGVYGLRFEGPRVEGETAAGGSDGSACGEGLAVLRGGQILGSDRYGGVFKGRYRYDAACGEAFVEVRLAIPPNGVLLTGLEAGPDGAFVDVSGRFQPPKPVSCAVVDVSGVPMAVELRFVGPLTR